MAGSPMGRKSTAVHGRPLRKAETGSVYGLIIRAHGGCKFEVYCSDNVTRMAHLRGSMVKRVWVKEDDLVLCSLREGPGLVCDVEQKYTDQEIKALKETGDITEMFLGRNETVGDSKVEFSML